MKINDIVGRISYNKDIIFRIRKIVNNTAILEGVYIRLFATAPLDDLVLIEHDEIQRLDSKDMDYYQQVIQSNKKKSRHLTGKILHIDSDQSYLKKCLKLYEEIGIYAYGVFLDEPDFYKHIVSLIEQVNPDIVILTGHDSFNKKDIKDLNNYTNTLDYIKAIKEIRKKYSKDHIFIFAGACQSNFEALIAAGANFASSPKRINIDAYDPAIVGIKAATTALSELVSGVEIYSHSAVKSGGISGVESYGKMRLLL